MLRATDPSDHPGGASGNRAGGRRLRSHHQHDLDGDTWQLCSGTEIPAAPGTVGLFVDGKVIEQHASEDMRLTAWTRLCTLMVTYKKATNSRPRVTFGVKR